MGLDLSLAAKRTNLPAKCNRDDTEYEDDNEYLDGCDPWEWREHFYHAGYATLMVIRKYIAAVEGIPDLDAMPGYRDSMTMYRFRPGFEPTAGDWDNYKGDLLPLLLHSDCDGELSPEECKQMAPRLRQILDVAPIWVNRYEQFRNLVVGIEKAAAEDLYVLFR